MASLHLNIEELHNYCTTMLRDVVKVCEKENIPYYVIYGTLLGVVRHNGPIPWDPDVDIYVPENNLKEFVDTIEKNLGDKYWVDFRKEGIVPKPFPRIGLRGYETEILHIDVFRMSGLPNSKIKQKILTRNGRMLWISWKAKVIKPKEYYVDKKKRFGGYFFKVLVAPFSVNKIIKCIDRLCNKYDVFSTNYVGRAMGQGAIYDKNHFLECERHKFADFEVRTPKNPQKLLGIMYGDYLKYPSEEYRTKMMDREFEIKEL